MGNVKINIYCYLTADTLTKGLQKCFLSSPLRNVSFLSNLLNLIGFHGNMETERLNLQKHYSKHISAAAIRGMKLKLCRTVITLASTKNYVFIAVDRVLLLLWQLNVSIDL